MNHDQLAHIDLCRKQMLYAQARMLATFEAVPDERLNWSPAPGAKTPMQILSHCVHANQEVTRVLTGDITEAVRDFTFLIDSRDDALRQLDESVDAFQSALDAMTPELFESVAMSPDGPSPVSEWMHFLGWHLAEHAGQIDYLQTCWDDQESHYPAE